MRSIINISVPGHIKQQVDTAVKQGGYATKSEFFRDLLRTWQENHILRELQASRKSIKNKKGKVLGSLKYLR